VASQTIRLDVPGARLAVEDEGVGEPIVLVHSAIVNRRSWDALTPLLVQFGYRVVRYDMRGFGESTAQAVEFSPRADLFAVMDARGIGKAAVIGNSWGAMNALEAAIESPDRFAALVWLGGGVGGFEGGKTPEEQRLMDAEAKAEEDGDLDLAAELDTRIWVDGVGQPSSRVASDVREAVKRMDREVLEPGREYGTPVQPERRANDRLAELSIPVLAIVGELDTSGTRAAARRLADGAANVRLESWPGIAHMIAMEAPDRVASLLVEFLAPLPRWS